MPYGGTSLRLAADTHHRTRLLCPDNLETDMNNDSHIKIADLRILDPDAAAELDEQANAAPAAPVTTTGRSRLVGANSMRAPRRSDFGATGAGEARFLQARNMNRIGELAEEMGLIDDYGLPAQRLPKTVTEVAADAARDDERAVTMARNRAYKTRHAAKHPHRLALANAKLNLRNSTAALENTRGELARIEAAKVELATRPGYEREIELREIVGKETVWGKALRKSLQAIERWERELPGLEQAAAQEEGRLA